MDNYVKGASVFDVANVFNLRLIAVGGIIKKSHSQLHMKVAYIDLYNIFGG